MAKCQHSIPNLGLKDRLPTSHWFLYDITPYKKCHIVIIKGCLRYSVRTRMGLHEMILFSGLIL